MISIGNEVPAFCLLDQSGKEFCLADEKGKWVVLFIYVRDSTPGCTNEAMDFQEYLPSFRQLGAEVVGLSPDSVKSHSRFSDKLTLDYPILSDPEHRVIEACGFWQLKKMYGREKMGVVRSTVLIDPVGKVAYLWEKTKVKEHAKNVLDKLRELETQFNT